MSSANIGGSAGRGGATRTAWANVALNTDPPTEAGAAIDVGAAIDAGTATAADGPARPQRSTATQIPTRVLAI
jgi:hypothetical protein